MGELRVVKTVVLSRVELGLRPVFRLLLWGFSTPLCNSLHINFSHEEMDAVTGMTHIVLEPKK